MFQLLQKAVRNVHAVNYHGGAVPPEIDGLADEIVLFACRSYDERLVRSEEKFDTLFDNADMVILNINPGGRIEKINLRGARILGLPPREIPGTQLSPVHPDDLPILTRNFGHVLTGNPQIFAIRAKTGGNETRYLDMALTPVIEGGRIAGMRAIARNVTEQMELQNGWPNPRKNSAASSKTPATRSCWWRWRTAGSSMPTRRPGS